MSLSGKANSQYKHGKFGSRVYFIWNGIKQRCNNKKHATYKNYGARGIWLCEDWEEFLGFYRDMGDPPTDVHSIERINNNDGYYKENCKWATPKEQANNRRSNKFITLHGETKTLEEWSRAFNIDSRLVGARIKRGWMPERALKLKPKIGRNQYATAN